MTLDLRALLDEWEIELRIQQKAPGTIKTYRDGVCAYLRWHEQRYDEPATIARHLVKWWLADLLETVAPGTVTSRLLALRRYAAWLTAEGLIDDSPIDDLRSASADDPLIHPLSREQIRKLLAACSGRTFHALRDEALIRFLAETGARASETLGLELPDVDVKTGVAEIRRGKGGAGRRVYFGPHTARSLTRYLRVRREHRLADTPTLWLGTAGKTFRYTALYETLRARARKAGIEGFHPHRLRHTMADRWLDADGSESGLMTVAGWSSPQMLRRYTRARAADRAAAEARRLNLGDV